MTLINRRFKRDLPIQPNYIGKNIDAMDSEKIIVEWKEVSHVDRVLIKKLYEKLKWILILKKKKFFKKR